MRFCEMGDLWALMRQNYRSGIPRTVRPFIRWKCSMFSVSKLATPQNPYPRSKLRGFTGFCPLRVRGCLTTAPGLRPVEPSAPAIHPPSKLGGILASAVKGYRAQVR